jgi:hypothetical protein
MNISILDALREISPQPIQPQRVILEDGLYSISDAVFSTSLAKAGVHEDTISWRLLEDVSLREAVIKMYEFGTIKLDI